MYQIHSKFAVDFIITFLESWFLDEYAVCHEGYVQELEYDLDELDDI